MGLVRARYDALIAKGEIARDAAQISLIEQLDGLQNTLSQKYLAKKKSPLGWLFGKNKKEEENLLGLYIYGEVGRGKTMLMDLFFESLSGILKKRAHFNVFMADVHLRINQHRQDLKFGKTKQNDPIPVVAQGLANEAKILCFDEFTVTDIADAMVLSRLFSALFAQGVILIATSNVAPDHLYKNGLNRQLFLPFIKILKQNVTVVNLDAKTDYRLEKTGQQPVYMTPLNEMSANKMQEAWQNILGNEMDSQMDNKASSAMDLEVLGHKVHVPQVFKDNARFSYGDLCEKHLAAADYMAITDKFHTIFIDNVPIMDDESRNQTKRFILLIDTLYDRNIRLFISAEESAEKLYQGLAKTTETFEFERTASRLFEMQSADYLENWQNRYKV